YDDFETLANCFEVVADDRYLRVRILDERVADLLQDLPPVLRRCYITDDQLRARRDAGHLAVDIVQSRIPNPGATMSGDFGEIVTFILHAMLERAIVETIGPKKWRLKQDRTKPTPHTDVVQFRTP